MRLLLCLLLVLFCISNGFTQPGTPRIRSQQPIPIVIDEDQSYSVQFMNLEVRDRDSWFYPLGFTMKLSPGANYVVDGSKVIPVANYAGPLVVPIIVNDGQHDSDPFNLKFQVRSVNDVPIITGQTVIEINEGESVTITRSQLTIVDPDDTQVKGAVTLLR